MANLWTIITDNSTLPVQAGNNLWDHLNNQAGGGAPYPIIIPAIAELTLDVQANEPLEIHTYNDTPLTIVVYEDI